MTDDRFDTALRGGLTALADCAPAEAPVRAALARRGRSRPALVAAAALAACVVVAAPLLRVDDSRDAASPAGFAVASPRSAPTPLTATWLPPGLTEQSRSAGGDGLILSRAWHPGPPTPQAEPALVLSSLASTAAVTPSGGKVDLGQMGQGAYFDAGGRHGVLWVFDGITYQLDAPPRVADRDTLLRVARGLRATPAPPLRTALEIGEFPDLIHRVVGVRGSAQGRPVPFAQAMTTDDLVITVELAPERPALPAPTARAAVLGRTGEVHVRGPDGAAKTLVVEVGERWLVVSLFGESPHPRYDPDLVEIAESLRVGPDQPNPWLGR